MDTTPHVTISAEQKLRNLRTALDGLHTQLRTEGRYVAAMHVDTALHSLGFAQQTTGYRTPGHD